MDVAGAASRRLYTPGWHLLPRPGAAELPAEDTPRRYPPQRVQETVPRWYPAPGQCPYVPAYVRHQLTEAERDPYR